MIRALPVHDQLTERSAGICRLTVSSLLVLLIVTEKLFYEWKGRLPPDGSGLPSNRVNLLLAEFHPTVEGFVRWSVVWCNGLGFSGAIGYESICIHPEVFG
jgi:hypothetical protein